METWQLIVACIIGFVLSAIFTKVEIPMLKKHQFKQYIREEGPESHQKKSGTPTMGGLAMVAALLVTVVILTILHLTSADTLVMVIMTLLFGGIGFLDDYIKVTAKHNLGLRAWQKLVLQIIFGAILAIYISKLSGYSTLVYIPFYGDYVNFGVLYIPFVTFVMVAMANSVNLSDGLDGLCAGITAIISLFFGILGMMIGHSFAAAFCAALAGVCAGFLLFNKNPAQLFMGDTGSMALGGALASAAIIMKMEFFLVIAGFIYVMEALSVIIQVVSFKTTGKRVFKMAPIHHHFEMKGMKEVQVVHMFWGIAFLCCILAFIIYRLGL